MFSRKRLVLTGAAAVCLLAVLAYQLPPIKSRVQWRYEVWSTYLQNVFDPVGPMPTPVPSTPFATFTPRPPSVTIIAAADTPVPPTATPMPLPAQASLTSPAYERQGINNCGPATLSMTLHMYGWDGNQDGIASFIKPLPQDRNVNPDELAWFVNNQAGWLRAEVRVAGDLQLLKLLLAANYPVIIEEASDRILFMLPPETLAERLLRHYDFIVHAMPPSIQLFKGPPGIHVSVYNPDEAEAKAMGGGAGLPIETTVVRTHTLDVPFIFDSLKNYFSKAGLRVFSAVHPIFSVRRQWERIVWIGPPHEEGTKESYCYFQIEPVDSKERLRRMQHEIFCVLKSVFLAVEAIA